MYNPSADQTAACLLRLQGEIVHDNYGIDDAIEGGKEQL
jgi:hypothetical protein